MTGLGKGESRGEKHVLPGAVRRGLPWFRKTLLAWFKANGREYPWREPGRPTYELLIAEVLLQRTTATAVANNYAQFLREFPSWESIAGSAVSSVEEALKPLGLWRQKSRAVKALAGKMVELGGVVPPAREELEALPGVGQYIANAALVVIHGKPAPLLDATMARVLERFFGPRKLADIRYDPYLQALAHAAVDGKDSLRTSWAVLDLGALLCKHKVPVCHECPLREKCLYYAESGPVKED